MYEYDIHTDLFGYQNLCRIDGDADSYEGAHKELILVWDRVRAEVVIVTATPEQYIHLHRKPCTEAQALLILNQIKRELENEQT